MVQGDGKSEKPVIRNLSAKQIADRTGREKRIVLLWVSSPGFSPNCPHTMGMNRRQPSPRFNLAEVKAWLVSRGLEPVITRSVEEPGERPEAKGESVEPAPVDAALFARKQAEDLQKDVERRAAELLRLEKYKGELDYDTIIARLQVQIEDLSQQRAPDGADAGWAQRWRQSIEGVLKEVRQFDSARFEAQQRRGDWIKRSVHDDLLDAASSEFVSALTAMRGRMPAGVVAALGEIIPSDKIDAARRMIAAYLIQEAENTAMALSEAIVASVGGSSSERAA